MSYYCCQLLSFTSMATRCQCSLHWYCWPSPSKSLLSTLWSSCPQRTYLDGWAEGLNTILHIVQGCGRVVWALFGQDFFYRFLPLSRIHKWCKVGVEQCVIFKSNKPRTKKPCSICTEYFTSVSVLITICLDIFGWRFSEQCLCTTLPPAFV